MRGRALLFAVVGHEHGPVLITVAAMRAQDLALIGGMDGVQVSNDHKSSAGFVGTQGAPVLLDAAEVVADVEDVLVLG